MLLRRHKAKVNEVKEIEVKPKGNVTEDGEPVKEVESKSTKSSKAKKSSKTKGD